MTGKTKIEWTDKSWNPIVGCSIVSPGCTNCYAMKQAERVSRMTEGSTGLTGPYGDLTKRVNGKPVWTGALRLIEPRLLQPLRWKKPCLIFVNSMGDLFHENVPDEWIDRVFAVMALCPQHVFQVLTKRADRMRAYFSDISLGGDRTMDIHIQATQICLDHRLNLRFSARLPLPNVWLGVSAEDQRRADERIPALLGTPAAVRFVSAEPLLGPIDFRNIDHGVHDDFSDCGGHPDPAVPLESVGVGYTDALTGEYWSGNKLPDGTEPEGHWQMVARCEHLDWIIVGGESGRDARPMHPDWARSIRDQCAAAGVPFFFKQWGEWASVSEIEGPGEHHSFPDGATVRRVGKARAGRILGGVTHNGIPGSAP